ncbi:hypothetical protein DC345_22065 [Paenibacillus taichungensis]|uniref:Uncharacterized protein n=1 Tax=Paenibacillus taichungensis TaxID=484184 RepID=A0A329QKZ6_9BACL|nr:hypothetical protein DC345_22065 [Paenibacillus taichungensis]
MDEYAYSYNYFVIKEGIDKRYGENVCCHEMKKAVFMLALNRIILRINSGSTVFISDVINFPMLFEGKKSKNIRYILLQENKLKTFTSNYCVIIL